MTAFVLTDAYVNVNSNVISSFVSKVELSLEVDDEESTAFGATYKTRLGSLKDGTLSLTINQDYTNTTGIDDIFFPLLGTVVPFIVKATSSATGTGNPRYYGNVLISEWQPLANSVGELATMDVSWPTSGAVQRSDTD